MQGWSTHQVSPIFTTRVNSPALSLLVHPLQWWARSRAGSAVFTFLGSALKYLALLDVAQARCREHSPKGSSWWEAELVLPLATGRSRCYISPLPTPLYSRWGPGPDAQVLWAVDQLPCLGESMFLPRTVMGPRDTHGYALGFQKKTRGSRRRTIMVNKCGVYYGRETEIVRDRQRDRKRDRKRKKRECLISN